MHRLIGREDDSKAFAGDSEPYRLCCDSLLIAGSGRTCNKDTGVEGNTLGG